MQKIMARKTLGSSYALLRISHQRVFPNDGVVDYHFFEAIWHGQLAAILRPHS